MSEAMGNRDRPKKQPKRKAKDKEHKPVPPVVYEPMSVEVIKPKRKPRWEPETP
jgi:hypothetical protein